MHSYGNAARHLWNVLWTCFSEEFAQKPFPKETHCGLLCSSGEDKMAIGPQMAWQQVGLCYASLCPSQHGNSSKWRMYKSGSSDVVVHSDWPRKKGHKPNMASGGRTVDKGATKSRMSSWSLSISSFSLPCSWSAKSWGRASVAPKRIHIQSSSRRGWLFSRFVLRKTAWTTREVFAILNRYWAF